METVFKTLISLAIAGAGIYVLAHVNTLADAIQNFYIREAGRRQEKGGVYAALSAYSVERWRSPYATLLFKATVIFLGIWLLVVAYPIVFGPIIL